MNSTIKDFFTRDEWATIYYTLFDKIVEYRRSLLDCPDEEKENFQRWISELEVIINKIWNLRVL